MRTNMDWNQDWDNWSFYIDGKVFQPISANKICYTLNRIGTQATMEELNAARQKRAPPKSTTTTPVKGLAQVKKPRPEGKAMGISSGVL